MLEFLAAQQKYKTKKISIGKKEVTAMVADSFLKKALGLMYRNKLQNDTGMLFIFQTPSRYGIWMHNMRFPIDILWLDEKKRVICIKQNVQPADTKTHYPNKNALYVVELQAGFVNKNSIALGRAVKFS